MAAVQVFRKPPCALREQVWITYVGHVYEHKCYVPWCKNIMTVFDFNLGHDIPRSQGGATDLANLRPICIRCNLSMGSQYSITEWSQLSRPTPARTWAWIRFLRFFRVRVTR